MFLTSFKMLTGFFPGTMRLYLFGFAAESVNKPGIVPAFPVFLPVALKLFFDIVSAGRQRVATADGPNLQQRITAYAKDWPTEYHVPPRLVSDREVHKQ